MRFRKERKYMLEEIPVQRTKPSPLACRLVVCLVRLNGGAMEAHDQRTFASNGLISTVVLIVIGVPVRSGSAWTSKLNECLGLWKRDLPKLSVCALAGKKFPAKSQRRKARRKTW